MKAARLLMCLLPLAAGWAQPQHHRQRPSPGPPQTTAPAQTAAAATPGQSGKPESATPSQAPAPEAAPTQAPRLEVAPAPAPVPGSTAAAQSSGFVLNLQNAPLPEVIDILARRLRINYILDPRVKGTVTLNTYGEIKAVDTRALLETILRINGFAMVQVGDIFRILPAADVGRLPLPPQTEVRTFPQDEQVMLNLVFLKYATVGELAKLIEPFLGEGGRMVAYEPANLLLMLDNSRNMKRTMDLIALFDNDTLASKRVRLFEVSHGRPSDLAKELEAVMRAVSLGEKASAVKFLPIDRINMIVAIAPNPGVFDQVEAWLKRLDIAPKVTAGTVENYVYRVRYGWAEALASAIMQLYLGYGMAGGYGMGGYGGMYAPQVMLAPAQQSHAATSATPMGGTAGTTAGTDLTGSYLGAYGTGYPPASQVPRVIPNPMDNTLLIQATPQDYREILKLLDKLDLPPRQVLLEAKIFEVNMQDGFASGVQAYLQRLEEGSPTGFPASRLVQGAIGSAGLGLTAGLLVGNSRQLLALLNASQDNRRAKLISAPSLIATDSIPAMMNVGDEVPTLTSQAVGNIQSGSNSLFAQTVQSVQSGVTLNVTARITPSGIVTLRIQQEVSTPVAPSADAKIASPSFQKRSFQTQVTVQDGDTIAIGGIISETDRYSTAGVPLLHRIPGIGALFGSKSLNKTRTEMVVFITPRVIYDTNQLVEATEELKSGFRRLRPLLDR